MVKNLKERAIGATGSISGIASILGSWQVCHNICLGIIALLSILGITVVGMPLVFLTKIAVPLWSIAVAFLIITALLYIKKKCISKNLIILNAGLIIAGTPFQSVESFRVLFWVFGGIIVILAISLFIKDKLTKKGAKNEK
ncbi:MAG: hypothetical protein Q8Q42_02695 [Nanoarchaeota archaeon]|nr:hypothetical protein [Nanoarchaeota archaeon]